MDGTTIALIIAATVGWLIVATFVGIVIGKFIKRADRWL